MSYRGALAKASRALGGGATLLTLVAPALTAGHTVSAATKPLTAFDEAAVQRARSGAALKLQDPQCLRVLTDFKDRDGRTLDGSLEAWSLSAADYMRAMPFLDGSAMPLCKRKVVALVTTPGLPPVFVCPVGVGGLNSRFADVQARNPPLAEAMVIHEMLHTLGLGENPPTPFEITERIRARCR